MSRKCVMMNMKTVRFSDESRESPNELHGLSEGWRFNGNNSAIRRQQSGSVVMIWGGMIGNELIGPFCVFKELKMSFDTCTALS